MNLSINVESKSLSGWGRTNYSTARIYTPKDIEQIKNLIDKRINPLISRGLGRSYGDPAQCEGGNIIDTRNLNSLHLDKKSGVLLAGAGVKFSEILKYIVPKGFFLPVSPGTKNITVGGAISSDVHGKNHHCDGSFANHVLQISLIDGLGNLRILSPFDSTSSAAFWATTGGMGLTGVIVEAKFKLISITSSQIKVYTQKYNDLDSLMESMVENDDNHKYSVAWIDSLSKKGRGILTRGDHADYDEINYKDRNKYNKSLKYDEAKTPNTPSFFPNGILNNFTVSLFNKVWFAKSTNSLESEFQSISTFFYPLDGLRNWNRIYGNNGFIQYQFVVPDKSSFLISKILDSLKKIGAPSFLTVLKRFGKANEGLLSFPIEGWTLAVDVPAKLPGLLDTLNSLDELVVNAGGRIYLAKDSMQSSKTFKKSYMRFEEWKSQKNILDPSNIFVSDLSRRLEI